ncbi:MAG: cell division protein FtsX [Actinobacteria bacterium]|nr:MAG: cell division protein FtsX [Actinomycetota bacterium]
MSPITHLLKANIRSHARRYLATALAVILSMTFVLITLAFSTSLAASIKKMVTQELSGISVAVGIDNEALGEGEQPADLSALKSSVENTPGVRFVGESSFDQLELRSESGQITRVVRPLNAEPLYRPVILEGTFPEKTSDIILDKQASDALGVTVGDTIRARGAFRQEGEKTLTLAGIAESPAFGLSHSTMTFDGLKNLLGDVTVTQLQVVGTSDTPTTAEQDALAAELKKTLPQTGGVKVAPAHEVIAEVEEKLNLGAATVQAVILVFPIIAVTVAMIVVSTTFQVILQQRQREIALLRTLGARASQVRSLIVLETLVVGAISSLIAVILGVVVSALALWGIGMAESVPEGFTLVPVWAVGVVWVLGVLMTLVVGVRPALKVSRISPIAALVPIDEAGAAQARSHKVRFVLGLIIALASGGGIVYGTQLEPGGMRFGILLGGSIVLLIGALMMWATVLPRVTRAVGAVSRGIVGTLARENTMRSPGRTAATGTAIMIGVTLVATMMVGAASLRETLDSEVDTKRPFDLSIKAVDGAELPTKVREGVPNTQGIAASVEERSTMGTISITGADSAENGASPVQIVGEPDLNVVAHSPVTLLTDSEALLYDDDNVSAGDTVTLCAGEQRDRCKDFTAKVSDTALAGEVQISEASLTALDDAAPVTSVRVKLADNADATAAQSALLNLGDDLLVEGSALERQMYSKVIDSMLAVVIGLLGVSVIVSLVGVTNTLSLSVHERTRENGLLRALGLSRRQMRRLLGTEAVLIALTATIIGVGMGVFFAWIGMLSLPIDVEALHMSIPWLQVGIAVVVSIVSALLAAWLPGRRAAKVSPVEALASE